MPSFDYKAAKAAGYSDADIARFLSSRNQLGDNLWIEAADLQPEPPTLQAPGSSTAGGLQTAGQPEPNAPPPGDFLAPYYPAIGGALGSVAGGLLGGPVGLPIGASIGGAAGEWLREAQQGDPFSPGYIAGQGALQGGLELVGMAPLVAAGAGPVVKAAVGRFAARSPTLAKLGKEAISEGAGMFHPGIKIAGKLAGPAALKAAGKALKNQAVREIVRQSPRAAAAFLMPPARPSPKQ